MYLALFGMILLYILRLHEMFSMADSEIQHDNDLTLSELMQGRRSIRQVPENQKCRRVNWTVHFNNTRWRSLVVSPKTANLYSCQGDCYYPLNWTDFTNHSMMQSYSNRYEQPHIRRPCCVPTILSCLKVEHYLGRNLVEGCFENVVVEQCGCL